MGHTFHGRTEELAWLRGMFEQCAARGPDGKFAGPRMAIIVAESGIGKSRLVQELYHQLTTDPAWDPPECDYWPDAFQESGTELRTEPDMAGHQPKGPPSFLWLGTRWGAPDVRNQVRGNVVSDLKEQLSVHLRLRDDFESRFSLAAREAWRVARSKMWGSTVEEFVGMGLPFAGLCIEVAQGAVLAGARPAVGSAGLEGAARSREERAKLIQSLGTIMEGRGCLPTVLWLDDAQWIDSSSHQFVQAVWRCARKRQWPLLIAVTHWERAWLEGAQSMESEAAVGGLWSLASTPGVEVRTLSVATEAEMRSLLSRELSGLTDEQYRLLLELAAGNYLSAVECIGFLKRRRAHFEGDSLEAALSPMGVKQLRAWDTDRFRRVEQQFDGLAAEIQDVLGWGSAMGQVFIREVVQRLAEEVSLDRQCDDLLTECVTPLAIISPSEHGISEFRDRAFYGVASRYFKTFGGRHRERLTRVLREHLTEWINASFGADGGVLGERGAPCERKGLLSLPRRERDAFIDIAVRSLPMPRRPDWTNLQHVAFARALSLKVFETWMAKDDYFSGHPSLSTELLSWGAMAFGEGHPPWLAGDHGWIASRACPIMAESRRRWDCLQARVTDARRVWDEQPAPGPRVALAASLHELGEFFIDSSDEEDARSYLLESLKLLSGDPAVESDRNGRALKLEVLTSLADCQRVMVECGCDLGEDLTDPSAYAMRACDLELNSADEMRAGRRGVIRAIRCHYALSDCILRCHPHEGRWLEILRVTRVQLESFADALERICTRPPRDWSGIAREAAARLACESARSACTRIDEHILAGQPSTASPVE